MLTHGPELRGFFEQRVESEIDDAAQFIGRWENGRLIGVVAIWNWDGWSCEVGWAGDPGFASRRLIRQAFTYVFGQLGCHRVSSRIRAQDTHASDLAKRLGFVLEGCLRQGNASGDVHVYGLLKGECRWV